MPDYFIDQQGQRHYAPGAPTNVDGSALATPSPAAKGIVAWVYQGSRGGEPYVAYPCDSASAVQALLSADQAEVVTRFAFTPANDVKVPSGVSRLYLVRANPAERAALTIVNGDGNVATFSAADWGLYGNDIQVKVENGTVSGKKFTVQYGGETQYVDDAGDMEAINFIYVAPGATPPAGYAITVLKVAVNPSAADGAAAVTINYAFTGPAGAAINPSTWMAFDGAIDIAIGAQTAAAARTFSVTGILKAAIPGHAAGETYTESIEVASAGHTTSTATWSEITSIDPDNALEGDATYTGNAFALLRRTSVGGNAYNTLQKVADRVNAFAARGFLATLQTAETTLDVSNLDKVTTPQAINDADGYTCPAYLYDFIRDVSENITWGVMARAAGATGLPSNLVYTHLSGGADGDAEAVQGDGKTGYQKAFDALKYIKPINTVTCDSTVAAVHALGGAHITYMCGAGEDERNACFGVPGATSRGTAAGQLYALRLALASRNVSLCCQKVDTYQGGVQTTFEPSYLALLLAAIQAGRVKGTGITRKIANILALTDNPGVAATNWTVDADKEDLIRNGYTLFEASDRGYRVLRANTSYGQDQNTYFSNMVPNESLNQSAKNLRGVMQEFIGEEDTSAPEAIVKSRARDELDRQVRDGEIRAYRNLGITDAGSYVSTVVEVMPKSERLWMPITIRTFR